LDNTNQCACTYLNFLSKLHDTLWSSLEVIIVYLIIHWVTLTFFSKNKKQQHISRHIFCLMKKYFCKPCVQWRPGLFVNNKFVYNISIMFFDKQVSHKFKVLLYTFFSNYSFTELEKLLRPLST
jgi:hypothetical protein